MDKAEYALGIDPDGKRDSEKLKIRSSLFVEKVKQCCDATNDQSIKSIYLFLNSLLKKELVISFPEDCVSNDLFAFAYELDEVPIHNRDKIREYWKICRNGGKSENTEEKLAR